MTGWILDRYGWRLRVVATSDREAAEKLLEAVEKPRRA